MQALAVSLSPFPWLPLAPGSERVAERLDGSLSDETVANWIALAATP